MVLRRMVEVFAAYSRLWALSEIVVNHGTMFLSPGCEAFSAAECASTPWWFIFEMVLWVAVLVRPTRATVTPVSYTHLTLPTKRIV